MPGSEVKGAWLMTARRYIQQDCGEEVFARYVAAAPEESREALGEPVVSRWYPERSPPDSQLLNARTLTYASCPDGKSTSLAWFTSVPTLTTVTW